MSKTISNDLRRRVAAFVDKGHSCRAAARHFGVSDSLAIKLIHRRKATGDIKPARQGRPPGSGKLAPFRTYLIDLVKARPGHQTNCASKAYSSRPLACVQFGYVIN